MKNKKELLIQKIKELEKKIYIICRITGRHDEAKRFFNSLNKELIASEFDSENLNVTIKNGAKYVFGLETKELSKIEDLLKVFEYSYKEVFSEIEAIKCDIINLINDMEYEKKYKNKTGSLKCECGRSFSIIEEGI